MMNDMRVYMKLFLAWIRENKRKEYHLKNLLQKHEFWSERWMAVGGVIYGVERVDGNLGKDPHMEAFNKMYEVAEQIKVVKVELESFYKFRDSLTQKQRLFFDKVFIKNQRISEFCKENNVTTSRGYELKSLICNK